MEKVIKLNSRYEEDNYLKLMSKADGSESKTYVLKTSNPYLRIGYTVNNRKFIDPSGGPVITEGARLEEADAVVKSIDFTTGFGYTITFK